MKGMCEDRDVRLDEWPVVYGRYICEDVETKKVVCAGPSS